jgi:hypothetical protein
MNQRTEEVEQAGGGKRSLFGEWACAAILAAIVFFFFLGRAPTVLLPWTSAAIVTFQSGVEEFGGHVLPGPEPATRDAMLAGVLISLVIAPTLFLLGWRKIRLEGPPQPFVATILFVTAGAFTLAVFLPSVPAAARHYRQDAGTDAEHAVQLTKDELMFDLNRIGIDAGAYWIRPAGKGGGNKSFSDYKIPKALKGSSDSPVEMTSAGGGILRFKASPPAYPGSAVVMDVDSTAVRFEFEGVFKP